MSKFTICGLINLETTVPVEKFLISYNPINYKSAALLPAEDL